MSLNKPLILVTNRFDETLKAQLPLIKEAGVLYRSDLFSDPKELELAQALIIRSSTTVDGDFLNKTKSLRFLITATSGFDHIDLAEAKKRQVRVFHVPESQVTAAAEMTLTLLFATARKWTQANKQVRSGQWQRQTLLGDQIEGRSLGVIGMGRVGTAVAKKAQALGLQVYGYDPYLEENPKDITMLGFEELMRTCDIVSLHVPKTSVTRHMIKKETLEWMNTEATLLNLSRGEVVNEADLVQHLLENPGFKAGLDVFAKEPLVTKSPLLELPNVVLTPHVGASTVEALRQSSQLALDKALSLLKGEAVSNELPPQASWYEG